MTSISLGQARRLALHAQGLATPAAHGTTVADVVRRIGCLQLDPVAPVARSPLLVLHARLGGRGWRDADLDAAAYADRDLFDHWCHEASLCHVDDLPLHRHHMRTYLDQDRRRPFRAFLEANERWVAGLLADLRERGPLRSTEIADGSTAHWEHGWWTDEVSSRQTIGRMLHVLWLSGHVGVHSRDGIARRWHVLEHCLPPGALEDEVPDEATVHRDAVRRAVRMLGVARAPHVRAHFTRRRYPRDLDAHLRADPQLRAVTVAGTAGTWFAHADDLDRLPGLEPARRTTALSPFDNLVCDRRRTRELFGFDHALEIYVPKAKRRWGYYVLPILHGDRLVARADLRIEHGVMHVLGLHHEPRPARRAVTTALRRLARWRGATLGPLP